jgi:CRISPR/Cas system-associated exonuclease Cas4 (RecB family)
MKIKKPNIIKCLVNGSHTYKTKDNELYTGVTTILQVRQKDFLKWWTVKMMYEFLEDKLKDVQGITNKEWKELLMEGKKAHTKRTDQALNIGSAVHDYLEAYIKKTLGEEIKLSDETLAVLEKEEAKNSIKSFMDWEKENKVKWLKSEMIVASHKYKFAGTMDFLAVVNGKLTLGDFKTSSMISEDAYLQTAAYQICLEEMGLDKIQQRLILRIPKDGKEVEARIVPTDIDFDKQTFLSLREAHKWNLYIKNLKDKL